MSRSIRVMCVDDHEFLAEGLARRIQIEEGMEFVGWMPTADDLVRQARAHDAHVVLLDIEMPGPDPFEAMQDLRAQMPDVKAIILSAYVRDHYVDAAMTGGAWGYISKSDDPEDTIAAIRQVVAGEFAFGPRVLEQCRPETERSSNDTLTTKLGQLTPRELQVLRLIGQGLSRIEIGRMLHRSPKTVDNHRAAIMEKLDIHDRVELARYAIREGLTEA